MQTNLVAKIANLIQSNTVHEYRWTKEDNLLLWINDYDFIDFKQVAGWLLDYDDGGTPAFIQENTICIEIGDWFLSDYYNELKTIFPKEKDTLKK